MLSFTVLKTPYLIFINNFELLTITICYRCALSQKWSWHFMKGFCTLCTPTLTIIERLAWEVLWSVILMTVFSEKKFLPIPTPRKTDWRGRLSTADLPNYCSLFWEKVNSVCIILSGWSKLLRTRSPNVLSLSISKGSLLTRIKVLLILNSAHVLKLSRLLAVLSSAF
jgi:hypothetical protein